MVKKADYKYKVSPQDKVLKPPAHWHAHVDVYEYMKGDEMVGDMCFQNLVTNDKALAISYALSESQEENKPPKREYILKGLTWCDEKDHIEHAQEELLR